MNLFLFTWINSWLDLFLVGMTLYMCIHYQNMIAQSPETREEFIPGAQGRARMFLWGAVLSLVLTVATRGRPDSSVWSDISFTISLLICWWYNRWFLATLRVQPK